MIMKKVLSGLILTGFLAILLLPITVMAQLPEPGIEGEEDFWLIIGRIVGWFVMAVIVVAVVMIIWAGFSFMTASGDAEKAKKARNTLTYALIGVIIVLGVRVLLNLVASLVDVDIGPLIPF
jgi:protein-S-isoprenylcysteine O-methyltransferase Ste14